MSKATEKLMEKWAPMTKHIKSERKKIITSKLLEAQTNYFAEAAGTSSTAGNNGPGFNSQGVAQFKPIVMPLVARVFPELVTNDLVGVQPMSTPVGLAYALRYRYATTGGGATAGAEAGYNTVYSMYSGSNPASANAGAGPTVPTSSDFGATSNIVGGDNAQQNKWGYSTEQGELLNTEQRLATGNFPNGLDTKAMLLTK